LKDFWKAHVKNASVLPRISESIDSGLGLDDYRKFRVFYVKHFVGSQLAYLCLADQKDLKIINLLGVEDSIPKIYAYTEIK